MKNGGVVAPGAGGYTWRSHCSFLLLWSQLFQSCLDLGRSDEDNQGLIEFKDRLGAKSFMLSYQRWSQKELRAPSKGRGRELVKQLFSVMPDSLLQMTGRILYRHVG